MLLLALVLATFYYIVSTDEIRTAPVKLQKARRLIPSSVGANRLQ